VREERIEDRLALGNAYGICRRQADGERSRARRQWKSVAAPGSAKTAKNT
jgi:hypothetical protein